VSADRKGPLAAFIVVAVIAAILLVTSVRSQAATASVGRAPSSTSGVVRTVGGGIEQVVGQSGSLVHTTDVVRHGRHPGRTHGHSDHGRDR